MVIIILHVTLHTSRYFYIPVLAVLRLHGNGLCTSRECVCEFPFNGPVPVEPKLRLRTSSVRRTEVSRRPSRRGRQRPHGRTERRRERSTRKVWTSDYRTKSREVVEGSVGAHSLLRTSESLTTTLFSLGVRLWGSDPVSDRGGEDSLGWRSKTLSPCLLTLIGVEDRETWTVSSPLSSFSLPTPVFLHNLLFSSPSVDFLVVEWDENEEGGVCDRRRDGETVEEPPEELREFFISSGTP